MTTLENTELNSPDRFVDIRLSARVLAVVGAVTFVVTFVVFVAFLPVSILGNLLYGKQIVNFDYETVEGTIWNGAAHDLNISGVSIGEARIAFHPLSLLTGKIAANFQTEGGAVESRGVLVLGVGGFTALRNVEAVIDHSAFANNYIMGVPVEGRTQTMISQVVFTKKGCALAEGSLWTDVLNEPALLFTQQAFELSGNIRCDSSDILIDLSGFNDSGDAQILMRLRTGLYYDLAVTASPANQDTEQALMAFGFEDKNGALTYNLAGELKGSGL